MFCCQSPHQVLGSPFIDVIGALKRPPPILSPLYIFASVCVPCIKCCQAVLPPKCFKESAAKKFAAFNVPPARECGETDRRSSFFSQRGNYPPGLTSSSWRPSAWFRAETARGTDRTSGPMRGLSAVMVSRGRGRGRLVTHDTLHICSKRLS